MQPQPNPLATILVAEDEPGLRKLLTEILRDQGYAVIAAADGKSALNAARKQAGEIHLLITDVMMPNLDGFDLRERILKERRNLRILVISGALDEEIVGEDFAILRKPFRPDELVGKVREVLGASSAHGAH